MKHLNIIVSLLIFLGVTSASAQEALPKAAEKFDLNGHTVYLFAAPTPAAGKPWVWFAPTINGLSLVTRKVYYETFLRAGISIAGYDLGEVRGAPGSTAEFTKFYDEMVKRGYSAKPILIGQSRGGLMLLAWAIKNPEKTRAFVGIYPVCNLETWGLKNLPVTLADYKMSEADLRARIKEFNPIDNLKPLLDHKIPIFVVQGEADKAVPIAENVLILKERYEAGGGTITVRLTPGLGHEAAPAFFESPEVIDFIFAQAGVKKP